jgi:hypothetical protein
MAALRMRSANNPVQQSGGGDSLRFPLVPVLLRQRCPDLNQIWAAISGANQFVVSRFEPEMGGNIWS